MILGLLYKLYDRSITYAHAGVKELCTKFMALIFRKWGATKYTRLMLRRLIYNKCCLSAADEFKIRHNDTIGLRCGPGHRIAKDDMAEMLNSILVESLKTDVRANNMVRKGSCLSQLYMNKRSMEQNCKGSTGTKTKPISRDGDLEVLHSLMPSDTLRGEHSATGYSGVPHMKKHVFCGTDAKVKDAKQYYADVIKSYAKYGWNALVNHELDEDDSDVDEGDWDDWEDNEIDDDHDIHDEADIDRLTRWSLRSTRLQ